MKKYLLFIPLILYSCDMFYAGSYPHAESYEFDISKKELIEKIEEFKAINKKLQPVEILEDGTIRNYPEDSYTEFFFHCYFYFDSLETYIHCAINRNEEVFPSALLFTGITKNKNMGGWKRINTKDLSRKENKEMKKNFENEVVKKLEDMIRK